MWWFDGDNMTGVLLLSAEQIKAFERLRPHYGIFDNSRPGSLNNNTKLPEATISTRGAWLEEEHLHIRRFEKKAGQ